MQVLLFELESATMGKSDWQTKGFAEQKLYYTLHLSSNKVSGSFLNCPISFFPFPFFSPKHIDSSSCNRKYLIYKTKLVFAHVLSYSSLLLSKTGCPDQCVKATETASH